jgi:metal-responsive CopG/Arc/MetJ family transcriptional regulator
MPRKITNIEKKLINWKVTPALLEEIDAFTMEHGFSDRSDMLREAVNWYMEQENRKRDVKDLVLGYLETEIAEKKIESIVDKIITERLIKKPQ